MNDLRNSLVSVPLNVLRLAAGRAKRANPSPILSVRVRHSYGRVSIASLVLPALFCLILAIVPQAHAKGTAKAKGTKAHATTHAQHRAALARSPRVAATLAIHGQGSIKHVGAAMLHTALAAKPHKVP